MPFNFFTGAYSQVTGATTAVAGQVIQSAVWNSIHSDIGTALSECFTQFGVDAAEVALTTGSTVQIGGGSLGIRNSITGAGNITSFGSVANALHIVRFLTSGITISPSSALLTPGSVAIITQVGDQAIVTSDASANYRFVSYMTAQGSDPYSSYQQDLRNLLNRNGDLDVWQRGAGSAAAITVTGAATAYTADGWYAVANANQTLSVSAQSGITNGSQLCGRVQRGNGNTGVGQIIFAFPLDTDEAKMLQGKPCALQFVVQTGANWSPTNGVFGFSVFTGTGTPVKQVAGYTNQSVILSGQVTLAAGSGPTTISIPSGGLFASTGTGQAELQFGWTPVGTAGANDWIEFDAVQLEPYPVPSAYDRLPFDIQLLRCMRHYEKTFPYGSVVQQAGGTVGAIAALTQVANAAVSTDWRYKVSKRITPTVTTFNPNSANANWRNVTGGADVTATVDNTTSSPDKVYISSASVAGASSSLVIHAVADAGI